MNPRVTLNDIARLCNVHLSTVSLALRNSPKLSQETRERIRASASRLGYVPDAALQSLVAYRKSVRVAAYQSTIAWINNWEKREKLRTVKAFDEYWQGARARAAALGYKLEEFWTRDPKISPARLAAILHARNIRGLVIAPQEHAGTRLDLNFDSFSAVALGYSLQPVTLHIVTNHQFISIIRLVKKLRGLGYRRMGLYLSNDWDNKVNHGFISGFMTAQNEIPRQDRIPPHLTDAFTAPDFIRWIKTRKPDVIITQAQGLICQVIGWLKKAGMAVPDDIGLANLCACPGIPEVAGIYQNDHLIGATAIDVLVGMMQRNERGLPDTIIYTLVDGVWQPGNTVRAH
jgi:LacI family transcriptional regulator